jgi:hypothetical protein
LAGDRDDAVMKPVDFFKPKEKCMATLKKSLQTLGSIAAEVARSARDATRARLPIVATA